MTALDLSKAVGVVGCGTMGIGIAQVALGAGHPVLLHDVDPERAKRAIYDLDVATSKLVAKGRLESSVREAMLQRVQAVDRLDELGTAGLVIEAAAEDLAIKRDIFSRLEEACSPDALLASNTSSISITAIGAPLRRPERVVGMHFFNPAPLMRLVEVVSGLDTSTSTVETTSATAIAWGKVAIKVTSTPGFVVNRVARPFYGEALRVLQERMSDPATIDAVLRESGGFRMGPFELMDLIGLDVNLAVTRSVWTAYHHDPRYTPALGQEELVAAGRLGRKNGRGWFDHRPGSSQPRARTAADCRPPAFVRVGGQHQPLGGLVARFRESGLAVRDDGASESCIELPEGGHLRLTDGRMATTEADRLGRPVVLLDLCLEPASAQRLAITVSDNCPNEVTDAAVGLLQATGASVSILADVPGLVVGRTVAMLVNEAADVVSSGVATADEVDLAMLHGVNYPLGPLEWCRRWGASSVVSMLDNLAAAYADGHHRAVPWLRRLAAAERWPE